MSDSLVGRTAPPAGLSPYGQQGSSANLADILERVLDRGVVIAGDIQINLLDIELLTIKLRLLVASVDKAKEMGIDWWEHDPSLSSHARDAAPPARQPEAPAPRYAEVPHRDAAEIGAWPADTPATGQVGDPFGRQVADRAGDGELAEEDGELAEENARLREEIARLRSASEPPSAATSGGRAVSAGPSAAAAGPGAVSESAPGSAGASTGEAAGSARRHAAGSRQTGRTPSARTRRTPSDEEKGGADR